MVGGGGVTRGGSGECSGGRGCVTSLQFKSCRENYSRSSPSKNLSRKIYLTLCLQPSARMCPFVGEVAANLVGMST